MRPKRGRAVRDAGKAPLLFRINRHGYHLFCSCDSPLTEWTPPRYPDASLPQVKSRR
jgi:hypothetical protein